jgi:hypothetical protein
MEDFYRQNLKVKKAFFVFAGGAIPLSPLDCLRQWNYDTAIGLMLEPGPLWFRNRRLPIFRPWIKPQGFHYPSLRVGPAGSSLFYSR